MPLFRDYSNKNILFIHIPKTGGASIETWLSQYFTMSLHTIEVPAPLKITPQHLQYSDLKLILGKIWDYAFAIVRNPYERIISEYFYLTQWTYNKFEDRPDFSMWVIESLNKTKHDPFYLDNHLRPQYQFVDQEVEIFKFEIGIDTIIKVLSKKFEIKTSYNIPKKNVSKKEKIEFSLEAIEMVNEFYKKDFELFGYKMNHKTLKLYD